ncbi:aldo/keto reductase [Isoptericola sp. b490]|uniref:aldo/keto reductase n=1 Tax=Actinotalea lenta TaxID=3064654 RepID=UPI0027122776|nr:aldo/keto reductase [Isoptericola sp. b490]MDO8120790.1 aldo/keto reductase [Isoptericola sp. b490]
MDERVLGATGLRVSSVGLGTLTWGRDTDAHSAAELLRSFVDAGGTLVDTAASYGDGAAELVVGTLLGDVVDREDVVLCTKGGVRQTAGGARVDSSRRALLDSLDASLARLRTDHVDVFCVQQPDPATPCDEVAATLEHVLVSGRARYVALANHPAWRTVRVADLLAPHRLAAVQVEYSLLERGVERELLAAAAEVGAGVLAWSPLGRGVLTGKYRRSVPADSRAASAHLAGFVAPYLGTDTAPVVDAVVTAAAGLDIEPLEVALAWVLAQGVASAVVGARTPAQLAPVLASRAALPAEILAALDEVSAPALGYPERR